MERRSAKRNTRNYLHNFQEMQLLTPCVGDDSPTRRCEMRPEKLDITLAFKAISLSEVLSGTEKQTAGAIVDSFNYRTHQCDPSFDRIAHLIGKSRRTVIRAVERLVKIRFLTKVRHGGHFHRNAYEPNWAIFRSKEDEWKKRRKTRHWRPSMAPLAVSSSGHLGGDKSGTQTNLTNLSHQTRDRACASSSGTGDADSSEDPINVAVQPSPSPRRARRIIHVSPASDTTSSSASLNAAERRWMTALSVCLNANPQLHAQALDLIDTQLQKEATEAELRCRGAGHRHVTTQLLARGLTI